MRKLLWALFATAAAAVPTVVAAQDTDGRSDRGLRFERHDDNPGPARERVRPQNPDRVDNGPRPDRAVRREQPVSAPATVAIDGRPGRDRSGRDWNRRQADPTPATQPQPAAPTRVGRDNDGRRDWNRDNDGRADRGRSGNDRRDWDRDNDGRRDWNRNDNDRRDWNRNGNDRRDWNGNSGWRGNDRNARNWDRSWRNNNRYDWQRYRSSNRYAFRLPRYNAPYNWSYGYRRQSIGAYLFAGLFAQDYWINDPWAYRLPPAEWPYQWVRYYDDALLIDTRTGYVVDEIPGIFWY